MSTEQKTATTTGTATEQSTQRTVTVVTTRGEKKVIPFDGTEWSELKSKLQREGYSLDNMKCVESVKRTTLEHPKAIVPEGNFNLFLMPYKSKSGAMQRTEINSTIKGLIEKDGQTAKDYFTVDGKNYTQVPSAKLEELINSYPGGKAAGKKVTKEKAEGIANVVKSVASSKAKATAVTEETSDKGDLYTELQSLSINDQLFIVINLLQEINSKLGSGTATTTPVEPARSQADIDAENKKKEEEEQQRKQQEEEDRKKKEEEDKKRKEEEERKRKEREEDEKLQAEMRDLAGGFNDVRL